MKYRLSASVDTGLMKAAEQAVARGRAPSLSAWVNDALRLKLEHDSRLEALAGFVAAYEAEHGEITEREMETVARRARSRVAPPRRPARRPDRAPGRR